MLIYKRWLWHRCTIDVSISSVHNEEPSQCWCSKWLKIVSLMNELKKLLFCYVIDKIDLHGCITVSVLMKLHDTLKVLNTM